MLKHTLLVFLIGGFIITAVANGTLPLEVARLQAKQTNTANQKLIVRQEDIKPYPHTTHRKKAQYPYAFDHAVIYSGSLKDNIERIAAQYGWQQVVWNAPYDYNWVGKTVIRCHNLPDLLNNLLKDYPLQAVFYQGNHVLEIAPRNLRA